jgi:hypothetical protein
MDLGNGRRATWLMIIMKCGNRLVDGLMARSLCCIDDRWFLTVFELSLVTVRSFTDAVGLGV